MTKNVVALAREFVVNKHKKFYDEMMQTEPTIAQSIRDAAIDNTAFALGVLSVDWLIIDAFIDNSDSIKDDDLQYRTFMLFVAEALE